MSLEEREAYHAAGIGVLAMKLHIPLRQLSIGFEHPWVVGPRLEPLEPWCAEEVIHDTFKRSRIEDYLTVCLGGTAGSFLYALGRRRHLQHSLGDAGLSMKYLRRTLACMEPEVDRAFAIAFALLGRFDDGDAEATLWRLWQRAVELLRQPPQRKQLDLVARRLLEAGTLSGDELARLLQA